MNEIVLQPEWTIHTALRDSLGESPVWMPQEQAVYWVDFFGPTLHRLLSDGRISSWKMPSATQVGSIVVVRNGILAATDKGLFIFRPESGKMEFFGDPNEARPGIGYNDAKTDRQGRYWVGTFDAAEAAPRGILYCMMPDGRTRVADSGYIVCNGPAFSPDGLVLYFSDTIGCQILVYDVNPDTALLHNRRLFFTVPEDEGMPDGLTVDATGHVWLAHYGGSLISRIAPNRARVARYVVPAANVTSLCFGGPEMDTIYVTTGSNTDAAHDAGDLGGLLMSFRPGVPGLPETPFSVG